MQMIQVRPKPGDSPCLPMLTPDCMRLFLDRIKSDSSCASRCVRLLIELVATVWAKGVVRCPLAAAPGAKVANSLWLRPGCGGLLGLGGQ
mmetsp:Transcript_53002/g.64961  ORF Transcript_53002/g.64961 Transcript_53002/m.64961 type:complete len:90 (-) Transcript_53002:452-721(-)